MGKEKSENNVLDFKSTMGAFLEEEKPEVSQEEAIRAYNGEGNFFNKKVKKENSEDSNTDDSLEDEEHLKRLKKELLDSLERVNLLAKKIFGEKGEKDKLKDIKVKKGVAGGKGAETKNIEKKDNPNKDVIDNSKDNKANFQEEREFDLGRDDIMQQMREKVQDSKLLDAERSREE